MSGSDGNDRDRRLAEALRENLRRRKAQARARRGAVAVPAGAEREPVGNEPDAADAARDPRD